jgi:hypothetical protein
LSLKGRGLFPSTLVECDRLAAENALDRRIGVIGYCMGDAFALLPRGQQTARGTRLLSVIRSGARQNDMNRYR